MRNWYSTRENLRTKQISKVCTDVDVDVDVEMHCVEDIRSRIFTRLRIDSKESIPPAYVAWRAGTTTLFLLGFYTTQIVLKF